MAYIPSYEMLHVHQHPSLPIACKAAQHYLATTHISSWTEGHTRTLGSMDWIVGVSPTAEYSTSLRHYLLHIVSVPALSPSKLFLSFTAVI